jgi:hypothetical protein
VRDDSVVAYGRALAGALRAFTVLEQRASWFERLQLRLLRATYRQRLRHLIAVLPAEMGDELLRE